ncbi:MAG TPA: glycoside hydrolase family 6 protein [Thermoleophilaceae bacterium]|nr:glycoside hydrolase family 6 protein [Thermoleophilaceae bacterium]
MRFPVLVTLLIALVVSPSATAQAELPQLPSTPAAPPQAAANPQGVSPSDPNPLLGLNFYVDRVEQPAARWHNRFVHSAETGRAALMNKIASQPIFRWIGKSDGNPERNTRVFLQRAAERAPGTVPGITVLAHHGEKCSKGYTAGGRRLDARYRRWMSRFVQGLGNHRVIVALEPDGLGTLKCLHRSRRASRLRNINYATQLLARKPNVTTYIEGGASDWRPAREVARYLRSAGVHRVRGFSLNITHFDTNANNVRYGRQVSRMVGGKHFVVNTDENGAGSGTGAGSAAPRTSGRRSTCGATPSARRWALRRRPSTTRSLMATCG